MWGAWVKNIWTIRVSIPLPHACEACALPIELIALLTCIALCPLPATGTDQWHLSSCC